MTPRLTLVPARSRRPRASFSNARVQVWIEVGSARPAKAAFEQSTAMSFPSTSTAAPAGAADRARMISDAARRTAASCSGPADLETGQLATRRVPVGAQLEGLLVVEPGGLHVVEALMGQGAVEVGLLRLIRPQGKAAVDRLDARLVLALGDEGGAAIDEGFAEPRLQLQGGVEVAAGVGIGLAAQVDDPAIDVGPGPVAPQQGLGFQRQRAEVQRGAVVLSGDGGAGTAVGHAAAEHEGGAGSRRGGKGDQGRQRGGVSKHGLWGHDVSSPACDVRAVNITRFQRSEISR